MHEFEPNPLFEHFLSKSGFLLAFKAGTVKNYAQNCLQAPAE